jgi:sugar lactone lactonase YvrE
MWMDYAVEVYSPDGKILKRIEFPAKCPTCPAWGGENYDILYVASSPPFHEKVPDDEGGHVFSYHAGVKGQVNHEFIL